MPNTPQFAHGLKGQISINGSGFYAMTIRYNESTPLEDITYTQPATATFAVKIPGYVSGSGQVSFIWDTANKPILSPYSIYAGALLALIVNPDNASPFTFNAYVGSFEWTTGPTAGALKCTFNYESTGTITRPSS